MKEIILTSSVEEGIRIHSVFINNLSINALNCKTEEEYREYLDNNGFENLWDYCKEDLAEKLENSADGQKLIQIGDRFYETNLDIPQF